MAARLTATFAPIAALLALAALFAVVALLMPTARDALLVAAGVTAAAAGTVAVVLLHRQTSRWQAASRDLESAEAHFSDLVESAMDPIVTADAGQRVVAFNAAAERVFGLPRSAVIGRSLALLMPERFRSDHGTHIARFATTGVTSRRMGAQPVLTALRADGTEFPIEASISQHAHGSAQFYTVILRDVSDRVRAHEDLRRSKEELQELSATAQIAREQEMSRIARELHDELGQALTMLQMDVAWGKAHLPAGHPDFAGRLDRMEKLLKSTVAATRRIAADLRPLILDDLGLVPAVESLVQNFTQRTGVPCTLAVDDRDLALASLHSTAVFRIVQESLTNVAKHAGAKSAAVSIAREGDRIVVRVRDDGVGFVAQDPRKPNSFGLVGLRERAALLRGEAAITTAPGQGTTVEVRLPAVAAGGAP